MADDDTRRLLDGAREYIEGHGWYQGWYTGPDGAVCALGALGAASRELGLEWDGTTDRKETPEFKAGEALASVLPVDGAGEPHEIPDWNDDPNTTKEDVLLAFKRAAEEVA